MTTPPVPTEATTTASAREVIARALSRFLPLALVGPACDDIEAAQADAGYVVVPVSLLNEILGDYSHPHFTDRYSMADRLRAMLSASEPQDKETGNG